MLFDELASGNRTSIPYGGKLQDNGVQVYPYFNLKKEPEKLNSLPEIKRCAELKAVLQEINHPRSLFRSTGCISLHHVTTKRAKLEKFSKFAGVQVVFDVLNRNASKNLFESVFCELAKAVVTNKRITDHVVIRMEIQPMEFVTNNLQGFGVIIGVVGYGRSRDEAKERWRMGMKFLRLFFRQQRLNSQDILGDVSQTLW